MPKKSDTTRSKRPAAKQGPPIRRTKTDVLLGRGRGCTGSEGNQRYLAIVEQFAPIYMKASNRKAQYRVKLSIIDAVKENGGRFLQPVAGSNEQEWQEADLQIVLDKIAQSLRYHNRKLKSEEDQPAPKPAPSVISVPQPASTAQLPGFASIASPSAVALDPAAIWPMVSQVSAHQQLAPGLYTNPSLNTGLNPALLGGGGSFHSPWLLGTLQNAAHEERVRDELWRQVAFLQGAQGSVDRLFHA